MKTLDELMESLNGDEKQAEHAVHPLDIIQGLHVVVEAMIDIALLLGMFDEKSFEVACKNVRDFDQLPTAPDILQHRRTALLGKLREYAQNR